MAERLMLPEFDEYVPAESRFGTFSSLRPQQKEVLEELIYSTVVIKERETDTTTYIHEATGIGRLAISTGILRLLKEGNLRAGNKGEPTMVPVYEVNEPLTSSEA